MHGEADGCPLRAASASHARRPLHACRLTDPAVVFPAIPTSASVGVRTGLGSAVPELTEVALASMFALVWCVAQRFRRTSELRTVGHSSVFGRTFWQRRRDADRAIGLSLPHSLILGAGPDITFDVEQLGRAAAPKYRVAAVVFSDGLLESDAVTASGLPLTNWNNAVTDAIALANADVVILASHPGDGGEFVRALFWRLETSPAELVAPSCLDSVDRSRTRCHTAKGLPLLHVSTPTLSGGKHRVTRATVILLSGFALLVLALAFGVIALLMRRDSESAVFFRQERVGVDVTRFSMIKFRSMAMIAEVDIAALLEKDESDGVLLTTQADPRVTRIGSVQPPYSLDELPQIRNISVRKLSIVGSRLPLVREVEQFDDRVPRRRYIKPGLTGTGQLGGRSDLSWDESIRLNLRHVENCSVLGDQRIMRRTVGVVIEPVRGVLASA